MRLLLAFFLAATPLLGNDAPVATIFSYHEVDSPETAHETVPPPAESGDAVAEKLRYTVTPEAFASQLDYLEANGYHVIPLADLVDCVYGRGKSLPPKPVVITADDGWLCSYTTMFPELQRRRMPFSLFISSNGSEMG